VLLIMAMVAAGCAPSKGSISGKVIYKETPLKGGNVTFISTDGKQTLSTPIKDDGTYSIENMPVGPVTITVETESLASAAQAATQAGKSHRNTPPPGSGAPPGYGGSDAADFAKRYVKIPDNYANPDTSGLTYTVTPGSQTHDIELKK
jgi:hypothetical protein